VNNDRMLQLRIDNVSGFFDAPCLMCGVTARVVGSGTRDAFTCCSDVGIVVDRHVLEVPMELFACTLQAAAASTLKACVP
jgi:hypothetical protein